MIKLLMVISILFFGTTHLALSQEPVEDAEDHSIMEDRNIPQEDSMAVSPPLEEEDQQINKDEGYGANDEEYYSAEEINAENAFEK